MRQTKDGRYYVNDLRKQYPDMPDNCLRCQLFLEANSWKVPYRLMHEGSSGSIILLVGMNPGRNEDEQGEAFIGRSGKALKRYVRRYLADHTVYVTNALKCFHGDVKLSKSTHINNCLVFLREDVIELKPDVIVGLGKWAKEAVKELDNEQE